VTAIGSLCSGIGGLELGLERAIPGARTVWQVEIDPFCRRVLARHWPHAKRHEDIRTVDGTALAPVDIICAGFPCQDISYAGRGAGLDGERSRIFWDVVRIVAEVRPKIVVLENVPALISRGLGVVVDALDQLGFVGEWDLVSAASVGAPHLRRRLFIVAAHSDRLELRDWPKRGPWRRPRELRREGLALAADHGGQGALADADVQPIDMAEQGRPRVAEPAWARDDGDAGGGGEPGRLHPRLVEWMQGFGPGWTDLDGED
jgi:DNA (cytosine-5)-methyltransferase 1